MKGILNLDKEAGMSSAAAVARVRRILGKRAIGHFGTLDPQGTGVLLMGVGKATRLFDFYLGKDKVYEADFAFGYTTDTLDPDGTVVAETSVLPDKTDVIKALEPLRGAILQVPPQYSAKSVGGVRAYAAARQGKTTALSAVPVTVHSFEFLEETLPHTYRFRIACSSGTYIRSLCRDLAESVGSLACMTAIRRTRAGEFLAENAVTLSKLERLGARALIPLETALANLPRRDFPDEDYQKILNGIKIDVDAAPDANLFTVYCKNELFGLGKEVEGKLKITAFLKD